MWVYVRSEASLWTTGFYDPDGRWQPDEDFGDKEAAARRVAWLNGHRGVAAEPNEETGEIEFVRQSMSATERTALELEDDDDA